MLFATFIQEITQEEITKLLMMPIKFSIAGNQVELRKVHPLLEAK